MSTSDFGKEGLQSEVNLDGLSGEDQLWHLKARIRSEFPHGFYYIRKDDTISNEPWMLLDIFQDGDTHFVRIRPMNGKESELDIVLPLGELMRKPLVNPDAKR
jgi:hypothetical protein